MTLKDIESLYFNFHSGAQIFYLPHGFPRALLTRAAPANPAANPRAPLVSVCPPNILLFVFLLPPLVPPLVQGLNIWLAKYCVATPRAAPAAPASTALLPVKKRVRWVATPRAAPAAQR